MSRLRTALGIDPGVSGAIAVVHNLSAVAVLDIPVFETKPRTVDAIALMSILRRLRDEWGIERGALEMASARPKQGVSSSFNFGRTFGIVECALLAEEIPLTYVSAARWKRQMGLGKEKDDARKLAISFYPAIHKHLERKKDHNRAEAVLLAHWLMERWRNEAG